MIAEQIDLMREQFPKVREAVEVLKEVIETDVRTVPDLPGGIAAVRSTEEIFPMNIEV